MEVIGKFVKTLPEQRGTSQKGNLPRVELFCRYPRNGWDIWGNEVENSVVL